MFNQLPNPDEFALQRQKVLAFFLDRAWHEAAELVDLFGWGWNQRKNIDLAGRGGIKFQTKRYKGKAQHYAYRLITPNRDIDLVNCRLKPKKIIPKLSTVIATPSNNLKFFQLSIFK